ncbi:MAG: alpha/beta hydrolase [Flavobacteriales bacterium]|nr:alpha/beta hydrolase [Flavobacteriales bacterium]
MKKLICLIALLMNLGITTTILARIAPEFSSEKYHFFLLRGLTRESGHWGTAFEENLRNRFSGAKISYLDLPGSGIYHQEKAPVSVQEMMEFMRERMPDGDSGRVYKRVLVATSLGGMVATEWVKGHPEDFDMVCLIAPSLRGVCSLDERVKPGIRREMFKVILTDNVERKESIILRINSNDSDRFEANLRDWVSIQKERPMSTANTLKQTIAGMRYALNGDLPADVPLLILASKADRLLSTECVEKVHDRLGGALYWHESAGHGLPIDDPQWISDQLENWIREQQSPLVVSQKEGFVSLAKGN